MYGGARMTPWPPLCQENACVRVCFLRARVISGGHYRAWQACNARVCAYLCVCLCSRVRSTRVLFFKKSVRHQFYLSMT